jgi:hypothetical protein
MMHLLYRFAAVPIDTSSFPKPHVDNAIPVILDWVFALTASIAVLMIVICGFRYIAAHGDPNTTAQARQGILYSVIGLAVTLVAFSIVTFVVRGL